MAIKDAAVESTYMSWIDGEARNRYAVEDGWYMIWAFDAATNSSRPSGLLSSDYKSATLREAAAMLGANKVSIEDARYNGKLSSVCLNVSKNEYTIWQGGECVFVNGDGDLVAFADSI